MSGVELAGRRELKISKKGKEGRGERISRVCP